MTAPTTCPRCVAVASAYAATARAYASARAAANANANVFSDAFAVASAHRRRQRQRHRPRLRRRPRLRHRPRLRQGQRQRKERNMTDIAVSLKFNEPGYIANPYWPEVYKLIEIRKRAGVDRMRSESKIREGLESYLRSVGMDLGDYEALEQAAARPFYTLPNGSGAEIVIPGDKLLACLVNTVDVAPSRLRIASLRTAIRASDFRTDKYGADGHWERYAVVRSGIGKQLSNQRGFRSSQYIKDFTAQGRISCEPEMVKPPAIHDLLDFAGRVVGIGASRKMGWGRFTVEEFEAS